MQAKNTQQSPSDHIAASRKVEQVITSESMLEGGGFPVRRPFPTAELALVDPFLLFDHFGPVDWPPGGAIGAPDHPHRGFETVTYLLEGHMQHKDSQGHMADLNPGDVQWMTAGAGVVHSELPQADFLKTGGVMNGFQIWVNLPAKDKMVPPRYQDIPAHELPEAHSDDGKVKVRIIAGESMGKSAKIDTHTPITYLHFTVKPGGEFLQPIASGQNVMIYVINGIVQAGAENKSIREGQLVTFGDGDLVKMSVESNAKQATNLLLLAGKPLNEPVSRYGPFVMNTHKEIVQAIHDFQDGVMGEITV